MTTYQLTINIDKAGLDSIYGAGQTVTLVKSLTSFPGSTGNLPIAWISFQPLEQNIITWTEDYSVYATTTQLKGGASIVMSSTQEAQEGIMYTFEQGSFSTGSDAPSDVYSVTNQQKSGTFNFGLAQTAVINGVTASAPVSAWPVLYTENTTFTPLETVSVFLSSYNNNGVVITQVASTALPVSLSSQSPTAELQFNDATNSFSLSPSARRTMHDLVQKRLKVA